MDNSNNPNSPNNPNPTPAPVPPEPTPPSSIPGWPSSSQPNDPTTAGQTTPFPSAAEPAPISSSPSEPIQSNPTPPPSSPEPAPVSSWPSAPIQSEPAPAIPDTTSTWTPPVQSVPEPPFTPFPTNAPLQDTTPLSAPIIQPAIELVPESTIPPQDSTAAWTPPTQIPPQPEPPAAQPEPVIPAFLPSVPLPADNEPITSLSGGINPLPEATPQAGEAGSSEPAFSPLDNPWGSPVQPPPINEPQTPIQPSWTNTPATSQPGESANAVPATPSDSAPTDLSHLISNNSEHPPAPQPAPETLVVPSNTSIAPEIPNIPTENHKGIPKWLIGLGIGLLILVGGASAYFILRVGQPPKAPASLPATTTAPKVSEVKPPAPIPTPATQVTPQPTASGSANFGQIQGGGQQATSAADLLRQRQLQGK